ncbi:MAG: hypothetical protein IKK17_02835 [Oscillospiraceae bacterium]|nr:hypothetical protein [Oscillospiraceae bacterium]
MVKDEKTLGGSACVKAVVIGGKGYGISHSWDGSVLTVSSDSGSSSADLMGPAGARGPAGVETVVAEVRLEDGVYVSDLSFAEIKEHIDAGDTVVCDFVGVDSRTRCQLTTFAEYGAAFLMPSVLGADEYFVFTADGVTHAAAEEEKEAIPNQVSVVKAEGAVTVTAVYGFDEQVTTITLNDNGDPVTVERDDEVCTLTWEGFDE